MFKLKQSATYWWPVTAEIASDGGQFSKEVFEVEFKRLPVKAMKAMMAKKPREELSDETFVKDVVVGWKGITDGVDDVPFSPSALDELLSIQGIARAIVMAYGDAHPGYIRKN